MKEFSDKELEDTLREYIIYNNDKMKMLKKYSSIEFRDINDPIIVQKALKFILEP